MYAPEKVVRQRISVLKLAEQLGNAPEACRRRGMDRASFTSGGGGRQPQSFLLPTCRLQPPATAFLVLI